MAKQRFEDMVFEAFKDSDSYHSLRYQICKVREIMMREHKSFKRLSIHMQFDYCCTIGAIAGSTVSYNLDKLRVFSKAKEDSCYPFAIEAGFEDQQSIPIASNNFKRLK